MYRVSVLYEECDGKISLITYPTVNDALEVVSKWMNQLEKQGYEKIRGYVWDENTGELECDIT